jgi:tRNA A-37 threonylcarbamoyl transferase component Bud32
MSDQMELNGSYVHPHWRLTLDGLGLSTMKDWLALDKTLVDEPNQRGRGVSQVFRASVIGAEGEPVTVYIKHQRNYVRRSVLHPVSGQTTLYQEYRALMRCWQAGVPVAEPLFFAVNSQGGNHEAMLVSINLAGFQSLDQIDLGALSPGRRFTLIRDVASVVRLLHERGLVHQNLYPKHIFVAWSEKQQRYDVRFIDMERCRPHYQRWQPRLRDLETLARRAKGFSARDRVRFLRAYLDRPLADSDGRSLVARMERKFKLRSA